MNPIDEQQGRSSNPTTLIANLADFIAPLLIEAQIPKRQSHIFKVLLVYAQHSRPLPPASALLPIEPNSAGSNTRAPLILGLHHSHGVCGAPNRDSCIT